MRKDEQGRISYKAHWGVRRKPGVVFLWSQLKRYLYAIKTNILGSGAFHWLRTTFLYACTHNFAISATIYCLETWAMEVVHLLLLTAIKSHWEEKKCNMRQTYCITELEAILVHRVDFSYTVIQKSSYWCQGELF